MSAEGYLRRRDAANYLKGRYGWGSWQTLAKLAITGGGPNFHKFGRAVLYNPIELDNWARRKISGPRQSTSQPAVQQKIPNYNSVEPKSAATLDFEDTRFKQAPKSALGRASI
jgi:hypothetical protein